MSSLHQKKIHVSVKINLKKKKNEQMILSKILHAMVKII